MKLEDELKTNRFRNEIHKSNLNVMFTAGVIRNRISRFLKQYGLTPEQYNVIRILKGQAPNYACMKDINCRMVDKSSNTTRIIDKLLSKGLVERMSSEKDRREIACRITPKGAETVDEINAAIDADDPHVCGLNESEAQLLNALLDKMREA